MDLFTALALLTALAILFSALKREKIVDAIAYRKAVLYFIAAVVVESISIWPVVVLITRIAAFALLMTSFYLVCCSWGAPLRNPDEHHSPMP